MKAKQNQMKKAKVIRNPHEKKMTTNNKIGPKSKSASDAWGGRIGTRMSAINVVVINAGAKGATVQEVAHTTGESTSIVSAQLGWMSQQKKVATRKQEKAENGKKTFRYFTK